MLVHRRAVWRLPERRAGPSGAGRAGAPGGALLLTDVSAADWSLLAGQRTGLAVSGGSDSVALMILAAERLPVDALMVLSVDHGLRPEAADDVAFVQAAADKLGLAFASVRLDGTPRAGVQEWARQKRYEALSSLAKSHSLDQVATAHTLDDQAETMLLRLGRSSGLSGLAAMRPRTALKGIDIVRPLLGVSHAALQEVLEARGTTWRTDPSNADKRFQRVRVRTALDALAEAGVERSAIAKSAARLWRADVALAGEAERLWQSVAGVDRLGAVTLAWPELAAASDDIRIRLLHRAMVMAGGLEQPRLSAVEAASAALMAGENAHGGRCTLRLQRGAVRVVREARGIEPLVLSAGQCGIFDGRFVATARSDLTIDAVGSEISARLPRVGASDALPTAPGVFVNGDCLGIPLMGLWRRGVEKNCVFLASVR